MTNEAHKAGIEAAMSAFDDVDAYYPSRSRIEDALRAYLQASGLVLVPKEPTEEMLFAAWDRAPVDMNDMDDGYYAAAYKDMLAAAPKPFEGEVR